MIKNKLAAVMAATMAGCILFAGCKDGENVSTRSKTTSSTLAVTTEATKTNGVINHGHSISETNSERNREICRSSDVILSSQEALDYLKKSVDLHDASLSFELTDTSDDDPGAYMWYEFTIYNNSMKVYNATFTVIAFTDGTVCEGRTDAIGLEYGDMNDLLGNQEALDLYAEAKSDTDKYKYIESCYLFSGKNSNSCPVVYVYRSNDAQLMLDAKTGEMVGFRPDEID